MDITTKHNHNIAENRSVITNSAKDLLRQIELGELKAQECPVTHRFTKGCYLREIFMPAGTRIIGKIHATEHFNVLLTGSVTVVTAEGVEDIIAPYTFVSKAGVQKVVVVHEDCIWQTIHITDKTDLKEIESEVIVENYDQLLIDGLLSQGEGVLLCRGD